MKNLLFVILIAAFISGCSGKSTGADSAAQPLTAAVANKTVTLAIEGMTCTGCENTIQEAVTKIKGVTAIKASHLDSTAVVSFDSTQVSIAGIGDAITEAGYTFKGEKAPVTHVETK